MRFLITYHKDERRVGKVVREGKTEKMGNWRSRWERKRDLDRLDPTKDQIDKIYTRPTKKDYIVTKVLGRSPVDGLYFKAVPMKEEPILRSRSKSNKGVARVRNYKRCLPCSNCEKILKPKLDSKSIKVYHKKKGK